MNMLVSKQFLKGVFFAALVTSTFSCSKDSTPPDTNPIEGSGSIYALGLGVVGTNGTTNYVVQTNDLMNGTISLEKNGVLQDGYRDYANVANHFQAIGGLGLTDMNSYYIDEAGKFSVKTGVNLTSRPVDSKNLDGKTMLVVTFPAKPTDGLEMGFLSVDIASNKITRTQHVGIDNKKFPIGSKWMLHTGVAISGNKAFQTILPWDADNWLTEQPNKAYVAVYSYPEFEFQKVIEDERTGAAGAFNTRSGVFATESGDVYTISHGGFGYFPKPTKEPAILKIAAGTSEFDKDYIFKTQDASGFGRIVHAIYIGGNKLFASVSTKIQTTSKDAQWSDENLKFAIVDLAAKKITPVQGSPIFTGDGGRSFASFYKDGKAYAAAKVNSEVNIYEIDTNSATIRKGAKIEATFVGGIGQIK